MIDLDSKYNRDAIETMYREQGLSRAQARRTIFRMELKRQLELLSCSGDDRVTQLADLLVQAMEEDVL